MVHEADSLRGRKERSKRRSRPRGGAALEKFRPSLLGKGVLGLHVDQAMLIKRTHTYLNQSIHLVT